MAAPPWREASRKRPSSLQAAGNSPSTRSPSSVRARPGKVVVRQVWVTPALSVKRRGPNLYDSPSMKASMSPNGDPVRWATE